MKRSLVFLSLVIFMAIFLSCRCQQEEAVQVDLAVEETAAKATMSQFWQSWESGDIDIFTEVMAHDPDMVTFGTDAVERWVGYEDLKAAAEQQFAAMESAQITVFDEVFKIHHSGEVAWYSGIADFEGISLGEEFEIAGLRATAVIEKRDAKWVIVQFHVSAPVSGQLVEY
jgi:ketosteroid isomerase-like protein